MSMIIKQQTLTISCGDEVVEAGRCSGGNAKELFKVTVEYFRTGVCATRIRPTESGKPFKSNLILIYLSDMFDRPKYSDVSSSIHRCFSAK